MKLPLMSLIAALTITNSGGVLLGQDEEKRSPDKRSAHVLEMKQIANSLSVSRGEGSTKRAVKLRSEPLLRWNDPLRNLADATLWAWGETGRPLALLGLERAQGDGSDRVSWGIEFISLAPESLELQEQFGLKATGTKSDQVLNASFVWAPEKPGVAFRGFPEAPTPADSPRVRLAQLRDLIKRFAIIEHVSRTPDLLRLMPHPIDRYADPAKEQIDGAIFLFAHGTNPEAIVLIEAQGSSPEKATWRFAVARLTVAPLEVTLDRKEVWTAAYHSDAVNRSVSSYFTVRYSGK